MTISNRIFGIVFVILLCIFFISPNNFDAKADQLGSHSNPYPVWQGWEGAGYYNFVAHNYETGYITNICQLNAVNIKITGSVLAPPYDPQQIAVCNESSQPLAINSTQSIVEALNQPISSPSYSIPIQQKQIIAEKIQDECSYILAAYKKLNVTETTEWLDGYKKCVNDEIQVQILNQTLNNTIKRLMEKADSNAFWGHVEAIVGITATLVIPWYYKRTKKRKNLL